MSLIHRQCAYICFSVQKTPRDFHCYPIGCSRKPEANSEHQELAISCELLIELDGLQQMLETLRVVN